MKVVFISSCVCSLLLTYNITQLINWSQYILKTLMSSLNKVIFSAFMSPKMSKSNLYSCLGEQNYEKRERNYSHREKLLSHYLAIEVNISVKQQHDASTPWSKTQIILDGVVKPNVRTVSCSFITSTELYPGLSCINEVLVSLLLCLWLCPSLWF